VSEPRFYPSIVPIGAGAHTHDLGCWRCMKRPAVYSMPEGVFLPCWECQRKPRPGVLRRVLMAIRWKP